MLTLMMRFEGTIIYVFHSHYSLPRLDVGRYLGYKIDHESNIMSNNNIDQKVQFSTTITTTTTTGPLQVNFSI